MACDSQRHGDHGHDHPNHRRPSGHGHGACHDAYPCGAAVAEEVVEVEPLPQVQNHVHRNAYTRCYYQKLYDPRSDDHGTPGTLLTAQAAEVEEAAANQK